MNAVRSNNISLKYQRFTSSGYKVIGFTKIEFVAKSQFLCKSFQNYVVPLTTNLNAQQIPFFIASLHLNLNLM